MKQGEGVDISSLITAARNGERKAFEKLFAAYRPLLRRAVLLYSRPDSPFLGEDDLAQEASIAFYRAVMSFDLDREDVTFGLYARRCVNNRLLSAIRYAGRRGRYSETIPEFILSSSDPLEGFLAKERVQSLREGAESLLSPYENKIFTLLSAGGTAEEIASVTGRSPKSVRNAVCRIRAKLETLL